MDIPLRDVSDSGAKKRVHLTNFCYSPGHPTRYSAKAFALELGSPMISVVPADEILTNLSAILLPKVAFTYVEYTGDPKSLPLMSAPIFVNADHILLYLLSTALFKSLRVKMMIGLRPFESKARTHLLILDKYIAGWNTAAVYVNSFHFCCNESLFPVPHYFLEGLFSASAVCSLTQMPPS